MDYIMEETYKNKLQRKHRVCNDCADMSSLLLIVKAFDKTSTALFPILENKKIWFLIGRVLRYSWCFWFLFRINKCWIIIEQWLVWRYFLISSLVLHLKISRCSKKKESQNCTPSGLSDAIPHTRTRTSFLVCFSQSFQFFAELSRSWPAAINHRHRILVNWFLIYLTTGQLSTVSSLFSHCI